MVSVSGITSSIPGNGLLFYILDKLVPAPGVEPRLYKL